jgi:hypothetical protein
LKFEKEVLHLRFASNLPLTDHREAAKTTNTGNTTANDFKTFEIINRFAKATTPFALLVTATGLAHAGPTIDMSGVTSVMQTVQTACLLIGAIIVLISLVFSVFSFAGGNIMRGITGVAGVLFGGLVIGLGPTWISSLTGQSVG